MIAQDQFVAARRAEWEELERLLGKGKRLHALPPSEISRAAALYRALCADLMRARAARYAHELTTYLDGLASRAHNALYVAPPPRWDVALALFTRDFPRTLRRRARLLLVAALLFLAPGLFGFVGALRSAEFAARVLPEATLVELDKAYAKGFDEGRDAGSDGAMFGFYVWNNVGIAFRCFATGILFGLGSVFFLLYNGLVIGTVLGAVMRAGHGRNILTFIVGHAPFELTAIVIAGAAGLQLGLALIDTGGRTRLGSLRAQAREIGVLVAGAAAMLAVAAVVEGFWSPSSVPAPIKWAVAAGNALAVALYLGGAGRAREPRS
jgi:uncharacterized membrane protein SpoIIM required for sporulation